jgi:Xaa-Pro aminopeptidase
LLGNLDIERLRWPKNFGIKGSHIDVLARRRLWEVGLNYGHGTGHGVGHF